MEYGLTVPHLTRGPDGIQARGGPIGLTLTAPVPLDHAPGQATARFTVRAGDRLGFRLAYHRAAVTADPGDTCRA
jgi:alpha,alpha-trehalase